jgi:hypothetical protein
VRQLGKGKVLEEVMHAGKKVLTEVDIADGGGIRGSSYAISRSVGISDGGGSRGVGGVVGGGVAGGGKSGNSKNRNSSAQDFLRKMEHKWKFNAATGQMEVNLEGRSCKSSHTSGSSKSSGTNSSSSSSSTSAGPGTRSRTSSSGAGSVKGASAKGGKISTTRRRDQLYGEIEAKRNGGNRNGAADTRGLSGTLKAPDAVRKLKF